MAAEQQLERSVLERKEREELRAIADAMALDTNSRSKKADIIDQILRAAGVDSAPGAAKERCGQRRHRRSGPSPLPRQQRARGGCRRRGGRSRRSTRPTRPRPTATPPTAALPTGRPRPGSNGRSAAASTTAEGRPPSDAPAVPSRDHAEATPRLRSRRPRPSRRTGPRRPGPEWSRPEPPTDTAATALPGRRKSQRSGQPARPSAPWP